MDEAIKKANLFRTELNIEELPLFKLSKGSKKEVITFRRIIVGEGEIVEQEIEIVGSQKYGILNYFDQRVLMALLKLYYDQGCPKDGKIMFSRSQISRLLGLKGSGQSLKDIEQSIKRLAFCGITSKQAFFVKDSREYLTDIFTILDGASIYERSSTKKNVNQLTLEISSAKLGEWVLKNFNSFYTKYLDFDFFISLSTPLSQRLYRYLDKKRGSTKDRFDIGMIKLAEIIPLEERRIWKLKQTLQNAHDELIERGFLISADYEKGYDEEKVVYRFSKKRALKPAKEMPSAKNHDPLADELAEELSDEKSIAFYRKIVEILPEHLIYAARSQLKYEVVTGNVKTNKARLFNAIIQRLAKEAGYELDLKSSRIK